MRFIIIFACVVVAINAATDAELWQDFKQKFGRDYRNLKEENVRFSIFQKNLRDIEEHNEKYNKGETSYFKGINQFTDLTVQEFRSRLTYNASMKPVVKQPVWHQMSAVEAPSSINWVEKGVVTPVKDQGDCGSCWSFTSTGAMEAAYALKTGTLLSFSEQNLIDCAAENGCEGAWMQSGFEYAKNNGIEIESDYPYTEKVGQCKFQSSKSKARVTGFVQLPIDEKALLDAVGSHPVGIAVDADDFASYAGGVYDNPSCGNTDEALNHEILVVGYGNTDGKDYWLVKNSWGTYWGEQGYIKMSRNKNNQCGVATDASYPTM